MKILKKFAVFSLCSLSVYASNITVSGAASLKEYLESAKIDYEKIYPGTKINLNLGASGTLKKQVMNGAPVDIIFLASKKDIVELENQNFVENSSDIFENSLVVIRHEGSKGNFAALGDPAFVPAGKYSKEALENLEIWDETTKNAIFTKDVKAVMTYVERGEADWGIVYKSDAKYIKNSFIEKELDRSLHSPIIYSLAIVKESKNREESINFIDFLKTRKDL